MVAASRGWIRIVMLGGRKCSVTFGECGVHFVGGGIIYKKDGWL